MDSAYAKERTITVVKKDVFFDIDFLSLYYSEGAGGKDVAREDRIATDTEATGGGRIVTRMCDHRSSDIREALKRFIKPTTATTADDTLQPGNWVFTLMVPTEMEDNTLAALADLAHDYIVNGALADYYAQLGVQGNRESLNKRAEEDLARIRALIYYRPMP